MHRAFEPESEWSKYAVQTSSVQEVGIHQVLWGHPSFRASAETVRGSGRPPWRAKVGGHRS